MNADPHSPQPASGPPVFDDPEIDLLAYWRVIRKHWGLIGTIFVTVVVAGVFWTLGQPKIYEASATVDIEQTSPQVLGSNVQDVVDMGPGNFWFAKEYYETQYKVIASRAVSQRVVDKLQLGGDLDFLGLSKVKDKALLAKALENADPVAILQSRIKVDPVKDSHLVFVRVDDTVPARAAMLANAISQAYIDENADQRVEAVKSAADWLQGQVGDLKAKLEGSELALYSYKRDNDILSMSLEDRQNTTSQKLKTLSDDITQAQTHLVELAAQVKTIHDLQAEASREGEFREDSFGPVVQSPLIQTLKSTYFQEKGKVAELSQRYEAKHPKLLEAQSELSVAKDQLQREIDHIVAAKEAEYRQAKETEAGLQKLLDAVRGDAFEVNKKEIDYKKLARESENNQRLYDLVLKRLKETDLSVLLKTNNLRLLDAAIVPRSPIKPSLRVNGILAMVLGLLGGLGLAFGLEKLDSSFKSQEDVERILGLAFLGIMPSIDDSTLPQGKGEKAATARDTFVHTHPKSSVAECCRSIRTNLLFMSPDRPLRRLLVTSSSPQEGKTTTAVSLGIAMAQSGNRVLLVDTDMRRPRLHRAFGVANEVGLSTAVVGEARVDDCVKTTEVPNLWVLPCGPVPPNPAEMLHAERFKEIVASLSGRFDRIVFDSPPLAAVADAAVLATQVDGTLLVIKAGQTRHELALRALASLQSVNAPIAGAVLNDLDLESREYGYYYYYRRGYYGEEQGGKAAG
ncbi:MAG: GumC family protein [Deltaproteobacteria bacterium]